MRHEIVEPSGTRRIFLVWRRRRAVADPGDDRPIGQPPIRTPAFGNRVDNELRRHATGDRHRASGEERRPIGGAAPEHRAVPACGPLVRIERLTHQRIDAVGADQDVAMRGRAVRPVAIEKVGGHTRLVLPVRSETVAGVDVFFAEPRTDGLVDDAVQPPAMDGELRELVACVSTTQLAPDFLAETVGVEELVGADADHVEPAEQIELGQLLDGVRQRVDADAEFADGVGLLVNLARDPARVEHEGVARPPIPPPTIMTFMTRTHDTLTIHNGSSGAGHAMEFVALVKRGSSPESARTSPHQLLVIALQFPARRRRSKSRPGPGASGGTAAQSALVEGCCGLANTASVSPCSTISPDCDRHPDQHVGRRLGWRRLVADGATRNPGFGAASAPALRAID